MGSISIGWMDVAIIVLYLVFIVWWGLRHGKSGDAGSYFLAGRSMPWWVVGLSLFAASISSTTLIGQCGDAYDTGVAVFNYNLTGVLVMVFFATAFAGTPTQQDFYYEPLDLTGATVALRYKRSGDIVTVTPACTFYPENGATMSPYGTELTATYQTATGDQYECKTLLNVRTMTVPIEEIGQAIGEDLGLKFTDDLPTDFWDDFYPQDVQYIPIGEDYCLPTDTYSEIVDYLSMKGAFADYQQYGDIPFMILPAGRYVAADGVHSVEAVADI